MGRALAFLSILSLLLSRVSMGDAGTAVESGRYILAELRLLPDRLVLGEKRTARLQIAFPAASASSEGCRDLRIQVNAGAVGPARSAGPGLFEAEYTLPSEYHPQLALIIATARCGNRTAVGGLAHPLYGSGEVVVSSTPFSEVTLEIAGEHYGPMMTDGTGKATVSVVVPPGVTRGIAGEKIIELPLPPLQRVVAFADSPEVSTDSPETTLWIHAVSSTGTPLSASDFEVVAKRGRIDSVEPVAPGLYRARYHAPQRVGDGRDPVRITLPGDEAAGHVVAMTVRPGSPQRIAVTTSPTAYAAGSGGMVSVVAHLYDAKDNLSKGTPSATTDLGEIRATPSSVAGEYRWEISLPNRFGGRASATVRITVPEGSGPEKSVSLRLEAAEPREVHLLLPPGPTDGDGFTAVPVRVEATDRFGNPVEDSVPTLEASSGTLSMPVAVNGAFEVQYTPPLSRKTETVRLSAEMKGVQTSEQLTLIPRIYRVSLTLEVGFFSNFGNLQAPLFTAMADISLWRLLPGLRVGASFNYFFSRDRLSPPQVDAAIYGFPVLFHAGYDLSLLDRWRVGVALGLGPYTIRSTQEIAEGRYGYEENLVRFGLSLGINGAFRTRMGCVILRLRWLYGPELSEFQLSGKLSGIGITAGWSFLI